MWFISSAYIGLIILLIVYDSGPILGDRPVFPGSFCMHVGQSQRQLLTNCCLLALQSCIAMAMAGGGGGIHIAAPRSELGPVPCGEGHGFWPCLSTSVYGAVPCGEGS